MKKARESDAIRLRCWLGRALTPPRRGMMGNERVFHVSRPASALNGALPRDGSRRPGAVIADPQMPTKAEIQSAQAPAETASSFASEECMGGGFCEREVEKEGRRRP
jgi:hypothetical protein